MDSNKILQISSEAGRIILESGGETYRVEETIRRMCNAFGYDDADSYVTPTGIMISIKDEKGVIVSLVRRISSRTVNLEKISKVNDLSRNVKEKNLSPEYVEKELKQIDQLKSYNKIAIIIFSMLTVGFFSLLFGGNIRDFIVAAIIGAIIKLMAITLQDLKINIFFVNLLGGALATLIALISIHFGFGNSLDNIIIGSIMLLVPGIAITNAIRDTIEGDLVSGMAKGMEAILISVAIAAGSGVVFKLWIMIFGGLY
jgi:uncharacterized membrane protein YjjP (DUF1212 family)